MMQALFRDQEDDTLFAAEIHRICYVPDDHELYCVSANGDDINIPMTYAVAQSIIQNLYDCGKADLSSFKAYLNREDDDSEETSEKSFNVGDCLATNPTAAVRSSLQVEEKPFGGLFSRKKKPKVPWEG